MTYKEKLAKYVKLEYSMPIPPVCSEHWGVSNWIDFIDQQGRWHHHEHEPDQKSNDGKQES